MGSGIDSTLLAHYTRSTEERRTRGFACAFGTSDREVQYARMPAESSSVDLHLIPMHDCDFITAIQEAALLSCHPYGDHSVIPITFTLSRIPKTGMDSNLLIEDNCGDDCFGFATLGRRTQ